MKDKLWSISIVVLTALALIAFGLIAFGVIGGGAASKTPRTLSINGTGVVYVSPDLATINLGVGIERPEVKDALAESNQVIEEIRLALAEYGVAEADVQTTNFSVYPMTNYEFDGPEQTTTYRVDNTVTVEVRDIEKLGEILDAAVEAGANSIYGIQFGVADRESAYNQALDLAVENASQRAATLAEAGGARLGDLQSMSTQFGGSGYPVMYMEAASIGGSGQVPVSPGTLEIRVEVNVVYAID
ncbi:MAG: SIMPL domain-containing protein [Anaerolineales bacterium]|nr:SIMPL domain-containing protein [Anaerolineales bacterium]